MRKSKNMNQIKLKNSKKKNNNVTKKNVAVSYKRTSNVKKKLEIGEEIIQKENYEVTLVKLPTKKKTTKKELLIDSNTKEKKVVTKEDTVIERKKRNRRKYENQQKKYQDLKKINTKKKIVVDDGILENSSKEESPVKKEAKKNNGQKDKNKERERKEKRKFNRKSIHLTQTIVNIKDKGVNKINSVKEKTNDKNIPIGKTREAKKQRFKRLVKEAIVYAIILTLINMICIWIFDYFNILRLFDIKILNIIITVIISLFFNFFIAFMIDYFITEIWLKRRRQKEDGVQNGDYRTNEGEYPENIQDKAGE